jgi:hypothetical protein
MVLESPAISIMSKKALIRFTLVCLAVLLLLSSAQGLIYSNVFVVTGTIQFQGRPATKGLDLSAYIDEARVAEGKTSEDGKFELRIPEYDPAVPEVNGFRSFDDVIMVKLEGKEAKPTFNPKPDQLKIDLKVETTLDVKLSTWGKIKALFK